MRRSRVGFVLLSSVIIAAAVWYVSQLGLSAAPAVERTDEQTLKSFAALHPIDVHVHVFKTDPAFQEMLERLNLKLMDILVMDDTLSYRKQLQPQIDDALALVRSVTATLPCARLSIRTNLTTRHSPQRPSSRSTGISPKARSR